MVALREIQDGDSRASTKFKMARVDASTKFKMAVVISSRALLLR